MILLLCDPAAMLCCAVLSSGTSPLSYCSQEMLQLLATSPTHKLCLCCACTCDELGLLPEASHQSQQLDGGMKGWIDGRMDIVWMRRDS
ncbi:hypothetical protein M758_7G153300 [Ceratodon purpureus]|nr:hypothetical protein M758_7G153300 [Ceratodon purpureus]